MNKFPVPPPDRRFAERKSVEEIQDKLDQTYKIADNKSRTNQSINIHRDNENNNVPFKFKNNYSVNVNNLKNNANYFSEPLEKDEYEKINNLNILKIKHIEDMRNNILIYKLLNEKKMFLSSNCTSASLNTCNIILFGPSGSGKSSFIKTLYRSVYGTSIMPPETINKLIINCSERLIISPSVFKAL